MGGLPKHIMDWAHTVNYVTWYRLKQLLCPNRYVSSAECLIQMIQHKQADVKNQIMYEPELIVRESSSLKEVVTIE